MATPKPMYSPAKGIGAKSSDGQWTFTNKGWVEASSIMSVAPKTSATAPAVAPASAGSQAIPPAYDNVTGLLTDYGKSRGLPEVNATKSSSPVATSDEIKAQEKAAADAKRQAEIDERTKIEKERLKFEAGIKPAAEPAKPELTKTFEELREQGGIVKIEDEINAIRTEKADLLAQFLKFKREEPKGVAQGFAQGRISDEQQGIQDRIDFLTRQENASVANLNNKTKYIETVMKLTGDDYDNAVARYDKQFAQNLQLQTAFQSYKTAEQAEENRIRDDARAYLTSVGTLIKDSGKGWDSIDEGMKADIRATELRAGYAPGTLEAFARSKPKASLLGSRDGYDESGNAITSLIYDDGTGIPRVTIVKTGGTKTTNEGGDQSGSTLTSVERIRNYLDKNPELSRADLFSAMDKDTKLTASAINQLLDAAKVYEFLPQEQIDSAIEAIDSGLEGNKENWWGAIWNGFDRTGKKFDDAVAAAKKQLQEQDFITLSSTSSTGKVTTKNFRIDEETRTKLLESLNEL